MATTPKVRVEITASDRATAVVEKLGNRISGLSSGLMKLGAAYATVRMGFAIFEQLTTKVADYGEQLLIGAQRTGMTTQEIAGLGLMAKQKGLELGDLTKALGKLSKGLVMLGPGGGTARAVLQRLGIDFEDAEHKLLPMHDLLLRISARFASMPAGPQKAAAAIAVFGKEGGKIIPFLNEGPKGILEIEKRAVALGIALDEKGTRTVHEFGDQMVILGEMVRGVTLKLSMEMMPTLLAWTVGVENSRLKLREWTLDLESAYYRLSAYGAALSGHWQQAKGFWAMANDASDDARNAEAAYEAAVSKSSVELAARIATLKQLGDMPDLGAPKEDKDAKRRLDEIKKTLAAMVEQAGAFDQAKVGMELYRLGKLGATETEMEFAKAVAASITQLERQKEVCGILDDLAEQVVAFGQTEQAMVLYRLEKKGATEDELEFARAVLGTLEQMRAQKTASDAAAEGITRYREGLDSTAKSLKESLQTSAEKATATFRELTVLLGTGRISAEEFTLATGNLQAGLSRASDMGRRMGEEICHGLSQMIVYGGGGLQMLQRLIEMLVEATLQATLFNVTFLAAQNQKASGGGFWGVLGKIGGFFGTLLGMESGGTLSAGTPYLVGEAGPELFVPQVAGAIVSNSEVGGDRYYYKIDARGADPSVELRLRRALRDVHQNAVETAQTRIHEEAWRSGA